MLLRSALPDQSKASVLATTFRSPEWGSRLRRLRKRGQRSRRVTSRCSRPRVLPARSVVALPPRSVSEYGAGNGNPYHLAMFGIRAASTRCQLLLSESTPPSQISLPSGISLPRDRGLSALIPLLRNERKIRKLALKLAVTDHPISLRSPTALLKDYAAGSSFQARLDPFGFEIGRAHV